MIARVDNKQAEQRLALVLPAHLVSSWAFAGVAAASDGTGGAAVRG